MLVEVAVVTRPAEFASNHPRGSAWTREPTLRIRSPHMSKDATLKAVTEPIIDRAMEAPIARSSMMSQRASTRPESRKEERKGTSRARASPWNAPERT